MEGMRREARSLHEGNYKARGAESLSVDCCLSPKKGRTRGKEDEQREGGRKEGRKPEGRKEETRRRGKEGKRKRGKKGKRENKKEERGKEERHLQHRTEVSKLLKGESAVFRSIEFLEDLQLEGRKAGRQA